MKSTPKVNIAITILLSFFANFRRNNFGFLMSHRKIKHFENHHITPKDRGRKTQGAEGGAAGGTRGAPEGEASQVGRRAGGLAAAEAASRGTAAGEADRGQRTGPQSECLERPGEQQVRVQFLRRNHYFDF
jgi:hypothetical protein